MYTNSPFILPFNFILMKNLPIQNSRSTLLNMGYKFGSPLTIKNNPIIFDIKSTKNNKINFYTNVLYGNLIPSYVLLLCIKSSKYTIQSLVVNSTIIKNLSSYNLDSLKESSYMYGVNRHNLWRPIINNTSIFLPRYQDNMRFINYRAEQSYCNLIKQCHNDKITLKMTKGDLLIIDNKSVLYSTDGFYDSSKLFKCLYIK